MATHKDYFMPHDDGLYLPIKVGNALSRLEGRFQGDDTGENISEKKSVLLRIDSLILGMEKFEFRLYWTSSLSKALLLKTHREQLGKCTNKEASGISMSKL